MLQDRLARNGAPTGLLLGKSLTSRIRSIQPGSSRRSWLFNEMTTKIALGAVVSHAPAMTDFDRDPLELIRTGDWVRVDADAGLVTITRRSPT